MLKKLKELLQDLSSNPDDDNSSPYAAQRDKCNNVLVVPLLQIEV